MFMLALISAVLDGVSHLDGGAAAREAAAAKAEQEQEVLGCRASVEKRRTEYTALFAQRKFWAAKLALANCPRALNDAQLQTMAASAERLSRIATASNPAASSNERLAAINRLRHDSPADAVPFEKIGAQFQAAIDKQRADQARAAAAAGRAQRRTQGVTIGMTSQEVLLSAWGKPKLVNRTIYAFGVHEQWVYGLRNYLYFDNGILTTIQD